MPAVLNLTQGSPKNPMVVETGQDFLILQLLNQIYLPRNSGALLSDLKHRVVNDEWLLKILRNHYNYNPRPNDVEKILEGLIRDGFLMVSQYTCRCCELANHSPEEILKHTVSLVLTQKGYDILP